MAKPTTAKKQPKHDQNDAVDSAANEAAATAPTGTPDAEELGATHPEEWGPFDSTFLSPVTSPAPRFPVEALPENVRLLVLGFAEARLLCIDYVAASILTACSGAIGNRARLLTFEGDAEPLAIFTGLIGPPSVGKSLGINVAEKPLLLIDQQMQKAHGMMLRGVDQKLLERFDRKLRETVARRLLLEDLPLENENSDGDGTVAAPGIILSEFSGAGLLDELRTGIDGRLMIAHEFSGAMAFGAANQGLRSRGLILEGYDGKPKVIRTKSEGKVFIPALLISILGATQPARLPALLGNAHDGLAARTWWIYPDVEPRVHLPRGPGPVEPWSNLLTRLVAIAPAATPDCYSALVPLAAETREPLEAAEQRWADLKALTDGLYCDLLGRAAQHTRRLAALLSIVEHIAVGNDGLPRSVDVDSVEAAINIVESYLLPMGERVLSEAHGPTISDAVRLARFLARGGKSIVNVRADILRAAGSPLREAELAADALEELRQRHVIRAVKRGPEQRGRPSHIFEVHPGLLARQWQK